MQSAKAQELFSQHGMMRPRELIAAGIAATTVQHMLNHGLIIRLPRGLYQLGDAPLEALREALRQRRATPAMIAEHAQARGAWTVMRPYVDAFTIDG